MALGESSLWWRLAACLLSDVTVTLKPREMLHQEVTREFKSVVKKTEEDVQSEPKIEKLRTNIQKEK